MKHIHSIKFKLIAVTLICVVAVSLVSNFILYNTLVGIIYDRSNLLQTVYLTTMQTQLNEHFDNATSLLIVCANDSIVAGSVRKGSSPSSSTLTAQARLNAYLDACPEESYIDKLLAFHSSGVVIQASARLPGELGDVAAICEGELYQAYEDGSCTDPYSLALTPSINDPSHMVIAMLAPVYDNRGMSGSYIYLELGLDQLTDSIAPYLNVNNVFLVAADGTLLSERPSLFPEDFDTSLLERGAFSIGEKQWNAESVELSRLGMRLYACDLIGFTGQDGEQILFILFVVISSALVLACVLAVLVSAYISHPIRRLDARIRRIAENDFSFDPEIERPNDELGQIGHTVNEMTMSINHLLRETSEMHTRRKNIEIELLQSQVNPHFLYNTLDTIRWMAVIQQCPGIAATVGNLVNLLKNLAKGTQDKIPLREELSLLNDYIAIQNVRYVETFTFVNEVPDELLDLRIIKLTLQPLVENAIFHGIEPTGECGTITLTARTEGDDLILTVSDDGAGIPPEKLETLLTAPHKRNRSSLNGMGVANVHKRLQLTYGKQYGLTLESTPGCGTRVHVRVPKEV